MKEENQLIKNMQRNFGGLQLNDKAQKILISHVYLTLRQLVYNGQKYSKMFCRNQIEVKDIQLAMNDMNLRGFFDSCVQRNLRQDTVQTIQFQDYDDEMIDINNRIKKYFDNRIIKKENPQPFFDWIIVEGQLQNVLQIPEVQQVKQKQQKNQFQEQLKAGFKINAKGVTVNRYYLQQLNPNIVTDQSNDFLRAFLQILKTLEDQIDKDFLKIDSKKFRYCFLKSVIYFDQQPKSQSDFSIFDFLSVQELPGDLRKWIFKINFKS